MTAHCPQGSTQSCCSVQTQGRNLWNRHLATERNRWIRAWKRRTNSRKGRACWKNRAWAPWQAQEPADKSLEGWSSSLHGAERQRERGERRWWDAGESAQQAVMTCWESGGGTQRNIILLKEEHTNLHFVSSSCAGSSPKVSIMCQSL